MNLNILKDKYIKKYISILNEHLFILNAKRREIAKFKDSRRVEIYNMVKLTREEKKRIDQLYLDNYGKKIPYRWHRYYTAFTGRFDEKYFPELLYIPEFEYYMNPNKEYCYVFADKNVISMIASQVGVRTPKVVLSKTAGIYRDERLQVLTAQQAIEKCGGVLFIKPSVDSSSGKRCQLIEVVEGVDVRTGYSIEDIFCGLGENFVVQEVIKCHPSVSRLHPQSVNTFRIITYRWREEIRYCPVIMRMGIGDAHLDNAHAGGIFVAVENDGTLHQTAFTEFNQQFKEHPTTHVRFEGYRIVYFNRIIEAAKCMHYAIPQVGVVNWDFTLNEDGEAVLVEANIRCGSIWLSEIAHGKGPFGEHTYEILKWLGVIRKTKIDDRKNYRYGEFGKV